MKNKLFGHLYQSKKSSQSNNDLKKTLESQQAEDKYLLDDENAIILVENKNKDENNANYIMIHERLIDGNLVNINSWYMKTYYFGDIHRITPLKELGLFKVQNTAGDFGSLYDYKNDRFIIKPGDWAVLDFGYNNKILNKYNGILGIFAISSDYEDDDVYSYTNIVTGEKMVESFGVKSLNYYAILNLDGSIRGNKLFKGKNFSKIEEIVDLNEYESLENFKAKIKEQCNDKKQQMKQEYFDLVQTREDKNPSPYLDSEVAKVLKLGNN